MINVSDSDNKSDNSQDPATGKNTTSSSTTCHMNWAIILL